MRTILHVIDTTGPGGAETVYLTLVRGLDPAKYNSIATTGVPDSRDRTAEGISEHGWLFDSMAALQIEPHVLPTTRAFDMAYLSRIVRLARRIRADVIHAHLLTPNVYCAMAGRITGIPVVATFHGWADVVQKRMTRLKLRVVNAGARRIVFVSRSLREQFLDATMLDPVKSVVVYNGIDTNRFRPQRDSSFRARLGAGPEDILIGAVGNLRHAKAYDVLLRAVRLLRDRAPSVRVAIAGDDTDGLLGGLNLLRSQLELTDRVQFVGFVGDVSKALNALDVFVLPSRSEGFSLSTVEAMACGLPVVATRSGGPQEIVEDGLSGLLVDTESPEQLADALVSLSTDTARRLAMGTHARSRAVSAFGTESMVRNYERLYEELVSERQA